MYNGRHWLHDVVAGAGVGILSARVGEWSCRLWQKSFKQMERKKTTLFLRPLQYLLTVDIMVSLWGVSFESLYYRKNRFMAWFGYQVHHAIGFSVRCYLGFISFAGGCQSLSQLSQSLSFFFARPSPADDSSSLMSRKSPPSIFAELPEPLRSTAGMWSRQIAGAIYVFFMYLFYCYFITVFLPFTI